jgi:hypothetical protein
MSIFSMLRKTEEINRGHKVVGTIGPPTAVRPPAPLASPTASNLSSGHLPDWMSTRPLPVEAQIILRIMGEDIPAALELIKGLAPKDRAVFRFYLDEAGRALNNVDLSEGRF